MMSSLPLLAVVALTFGSMDIRGIAEARCAVAIVQAEQDFDARRAELGLIGSAPMVGFERVSSVKSIDFDARRAELGLLGSAPMVGLERLEIEASAKRVNATHASKASSPSTPAH